MMIGLSTLTERVRAVPQIPTVQLSRQLAFNLQVGRGHFFGHWCEVSLEIRIANALHRLI
jgi:hypothetical protein